VRGTLHDDSWSSSGATASRSVISSAAPRFVCGAIRLPCWPPTGACSAASPSRPPSGGHAHRARRPAGAGQ